MPETNDSERKFTVAKEVAEQIWREQQLTGSRMNWNLTFQSFLVAAFILSFRDGIEPRIAFLLRGLLCLAGFFVALATLFSVQASHIQRDYLKAIWGELYLRRDLYIYPRPFADYGTSRRGRSVAIHILVVLLVMWGMFLLIAIAAAAG